MSAKTILPLMQFVPAVSTRFHEPRHLTSFVDLFTKIYAGTPVHACVSVPPRHEKTETAAHGIAWLLKQAPRLRVCYVTYAADLAAKKSRRIRAICQAARVRLDPRASSAHDWRTGVGEGGLWATSTGGSVV